jgi:hypothetical protein
MALIENAVGSDRQQVLKTGFVYANIDWLKEYQQDENKSEANHFILKGSSELTSNNLWRNKFHLSYSRNLSSNFELYYNL